jgi:hypothetical protein
VIVIDTHHVPAELQNLLLILVGNKWPTGDEAALRAESDSWRHVAFLLHSCEHSVAEVRTYVNAGLEGATREAIDGFLNTLLGQSVHGEDGIFTEIARCCEDTSDLLMEIANEIETLRIEIIGTLVVLAVQLAIDTAALFLFGGAAIAAAEITAARVLCLSFVRKAMTRVLTRVMESVVAQDGFALLAQIIELAQHHRNSLDGSQLKVAAINGAVGGAVGFGTGLVGNTLERGLKYGVKASRIGRVGEMTTHFAWQGGFSALAGMTEAATQDAVFELSGDYVAGAANGSFNGAWGARHKAMNAKNLGSISPADHLEHAFDGRVVPRTQEVGGAPGLRDRSTVPVTTPVPPGVHHSEASGEEGPEVWQDVPRPNPENGPGLKEPLESGSDHWTEVEQPNENWGAARSSASHARPVRVPPGWEDPWGDYHVNAGPVDAA